MSNDLTVANEMNLAHMKVELDTAIMTAQAIKRDMKTFVAEATALATFNEDVAASCIYSLPRKKKDEKTGKYEQIFIKGKSIRLAEIIIATYENLTCATRIVRTDAKTVTVEGGVWDLQKRTKVTQEVVENVTGTHSDAVKLAIASASSKALRNAVFKIVPGTLCDEIYKKAVECAVGNQITFPVRRATIFERIRKLGISHDKIFAYYNKTSIEEFTPEDMEEIVGVGTAIKEGDMKIDKAFVKEAGHDDAKDLIDDLVVATPTPLKVNIETGETIGWDKTSNVSYDEVKKNLQTAKSLDDLHVAADLIQEIKDSILRDELSALYKARQTALNK